MNALNGYVKSIRFRLKWIFMSPQERYAILWTRTRLGGRILPIATYHKPVITGLSPVPAAIASGYGVSRERSLE